MKRTHASVGHARIDRKTATVAALPVSEPDLSASFDTPDGQSVTSTATVPSGASPIPRRRVGSISAGSTAPALAMQGGNQGS